MGMVGELGMWCNSIPAVENFGCKFGGRFFFVFGPKFHEIYEVSCEL